MVDVRDVAAAHCLAMLQPGAKGRWGRGVGKGRGLRVEGAWWT